MIRPLVSSRSTKPRTATPPMTPCTGNSSAAGSISGATSSRYLRVSMAAWRLSKSTSRSEEHTSELQSLRHLVCRLLLEKIISHCASFGGFSLTPYIHDRNRTSIQEIRKLQLPTHRVKPEIVGRADVCAIFF